MGKNMGSTDKTIRMILGIGLIALGLYFQSWWGLVGLVPVATSLMGRCLVYLPFGLSTCKTNVDMKKS